MKNPFIIGKRLYLRPVSNEDVNERYLCWLNDPSVLELRSRKVFPADIADIEAFRNKQKTSGFIHLAIVLREDDRHIGNITLGPINWYHRHGEVSILIGEKDAWGKGYGREAVFLISKHAFENANLHRVWSASVNPAFIRIVKYLGWEKEGEYREALWCKDKYLSVEVYSILKKEFIENMSL